MQNNINLVSIKTLYTPALAEGEGVGTAYEYFAKRLVLRPWLKTVPPVKRLLIAGLPEKYGASLDYLYLAEELGAECLLVDDRPEALAKWQQSLAAVRREGWFQGWEPQTQLVADLADLPELSPAFDLVISNEVLQRLPAERRPVYLQRQWALGTAVALFCPNAENPDHALHSGLGTLTLSELTTLLPAAARQTAFSGYIDMPPFPTGVVRSEAQRAQADSGRLEALAMWGLAYYARLEKYLPLRLRRQKAHIVYALICKAEC